MLLGDFSNEHLDLISLGRDFCWSISQTSSLSGLQEIGRTRAVIAVLIQTGALEMTWPAALRAVRTAAPRARVILCHRVDQACFRTDMVDAGAFSVLLSPLAHSEVRQSLGFVWASKIMQLRQLTSAARNIHPMDAPTQRVGAA